MWHRLVDAMVCPLCAGPLRVTILKDERPEIDAAHAARAASLALTETHRHWIETGALSCDQCLVWYPVVDGLPVMLGYQTGAEKGIQQAVSERLGPKFKLPSTSPEPGEEFVRQSFSKEWTDYDYDGVMWDLSYEDHERRFLAEIGPEAAEKARGTTFVEIGCGLGMTTVFAQKNLGGDAIGVDLGRAAGRAASEFRRNPFLHFIQASAFHLPLKAGVADLLYSHGVLHHTYSTERAVRAAASLCAPKGMFYLWLYGPGSQEGSPLRRIAFQVEERTRPWISKHLNHPISRSILGASALGYLVVNRYHRLRDSTVQPYNYSRAVHAARDRFTPLYAHRQSVDEVAGWLRTLQFERIEEVDWRKMPTANQDNYRRNTGVRGWRPSA